MPSIIHVITEELYILYPAPSGGDEVRIPVRAPLCLMENLVAQRTLHQGIIHDRPCKVDEVPFVHNLVLRTLLRVVRSTHYVGGAEIVVYDVAPCEIVKDCYEILPAPIELV